MALLEVTGMKVVALVAGRKGTWLLGATWMKTTTRPTGTETVVMLSGGDEMLMARG